MSLSGRIPNDPRLPLTPPSAGTSFFQNIQPWAALLSTSLDRDPRLVRDRSPLLFHAILLLTLYYRERTPVNLQLYRAVSTILDSILAPQILCPQPDQLSFDFVRAVQLLILYKPVQYSALNARGVSEPDRIREQDERPRVLGPPPARLARFGLCRAAFDRQRVRSLANTVPQFAARADVETLTALHRLS